MAEQPLAIARELTLIGAFVGDVRVFKAGDAAETTYLVGKTPVDLNNNSVYSITRDDPTLRYLGTTQHGKDGGGGLIVYRGGLMRLFVCEAPNDGDPGSASELKLVDLQVRNTAETAVATGGTTDDYARQAITALTARVAGLERADVLDGQRHTALVAQVNALVARIASLEAKLAAVKTAL